MEKEALAIKWALDSFRCYLLSRELTLETNHRALQWMERMKDTNGRNTWWYLAVQPFPFSIQPKKRITQFGKKIVYKIK